MVKIYDKIYENYPDESKIIATAEYNEKLDYLVNTNYQNGGTGRHLGFGQLKGGKQSYYLIEGTQWQGERNVGFIVPARRIVIEAIKSDNVNVLDDFPELLEIYETEFDDKKQLQTSRTFSIRVNLKESKKEVETKISEMKNKIQQFLNLE